MRSNKLRFVASIGFLIIAVLGVEVAQNRARIVSKIAQV